MAGVRDRVHACRHRRIRRAVTEEVLVLDVQIDPVEPVRGRKSDEVLHELGAVRVVAGGGPVVVARAADRDDRLDPRMRVHVRNPGRNVHVPQVVHVQARPVLGRQVEQDQLVDVIPRQAHAGDGSPAKILGHDHAPRRRRRRRRRRRPAGWRRRWPAGWRRRPGLVGRGDPRRRLRARRAAAGAVDRDDHHAHPVADITYAQREAALLRAGHDPARTTRRVARLPRVAERCRAVRPPAMAGGKDLPRGWLAPDLRQRTVVRRPARSGRGAPGQDQGDHEDSAAGCVTSHYEVTAAGTAGSGFGSSCRRRRSASR